MPNPSACRRISRSSRSRWSASSRLESSSPGSRAPIGSTTAAATAGPARGPRPTSSMPATTLYPISRATRSEAHSCGRRVRCCVFTAARLCPARRLRPPCLLRPAAGGSLLLGLGRGRSRPATPGSRRLSPRVRRGGVAALFDAGFLADLAPQVVEPGLPHLAVSPHLDALPARRVNHEGPLHADPVGDPAHGEVPAQPAAGDPDDKTLEHLDPFPRAFHHLGVNPDGVAGAKLGY